MINFVVGIESACSNSRVVCYIKSTQGASTIFYCGWADYLDSFGWLSQSEKFLPFGACPI